MIHYHDTGYGWIEIACTVGGVMRGNKPLPKAALTMQLSIRTWEILGHWQGEPAKNPRCILKLNDALNELDGKLPPCVMTLAVDEPSTVFRKLDNSWIRFRTGAIRKSAKLSEEKWLNYLEEFYAIQ